jgi:glutathione peroxidase
MSPTLEENFFAAPNVITSFGTNTKRITVKRFAIPAAVASLVVLAIFSFQLLTAKEKPVTSIYDLTVENIDGEKVALSQYKGKVLLIVNVASQCGYTGQYADLEKLYDAYKAKGFVVLGFPSNDFGGQEPGSEAEIKEFCSAKYGVSFPMFSKITVKGNGKHPLYKYLTANAKPAEEVNWNFNKFLVSKDGKTIVKYNSNAAPMGSDLKSAVEKMLQ